jgi:hypothetical protein
MHVSFTSGMHNNIFDLPDVWNKIGFTTDRHKKNPKPPSPFTNNENKWVGRHVTPLGHINEYSDS